MRFNYPLIIFLYSLKIIYTKSPLEINVQKLPDITRLEKIVEDLFREDEPAAAVLIMKEGQILFENYYGLSSLPNKTKVDSNSTFCIASISKQFTAVAILQLVSKGKVSLEEPLNTYFPEYTNPLWKKVKLKHLLSHSSGIPDYSDYNLNESQKIYGDENLNLEYLTNLTELHFEPGTDFEYINPTYVLIGRLIERITNQTFVDYVSENIFIPAGMNNTAYIFQEKNACHAYEYNRSDEDSSGERPPRPHDWYEFDYGEEYFFGVRPDGGIYTNPRDFIKWEKSLPLLLDNNLLNEAYKPQIKATGSKWDDYQFTTGTYYGYGWFIEPEKKCIYHTGQVGGFKSFAAKYPEKDTYVMAFSARTDWDRHGLKTQIEEIFDLVPKFNKKIIYIQQMQKINRRLKIFCLANFAILKNDAFNFSININSEEKNETKNIEFLSLGNYAGFVDKIIELESKEEFDEKIKAILEELKYDINIKLNENKNNFDTEKVKEEINKGEINYNNLSSNHQFYHLPINFSNEGCEFNLNSNLNIDFSNIKNINLTFKEVNNENNKINAECILSKENLNIIPCKLNQETNNKYILDPFIISDNFETITLFQNNSNDYFFLKSAKNNPQSEGLSLGAILGIVFGILGIIIIIVILLIIKKIKKERESDNPDKLTLDNLVDK